MTSASNVNDMRTVSAINNADTCITSLVNVEDAAMTSDLNVRDVRGQPVPFRKEAEALLKARHDELRARLLDYRARLTSAQAATKRSIDAAVEAAR
jgi:Ca-activated chloride channel family protein